MGVCLSIQSSKSSALDTLDYLLRFKKCIRNYFYYNIGEKCPYHIDTTYDIHQLKEFISKYNIKEEDLFEYEYID
jgi:hypothetical protein